MKFIAMDTETGGIGPEADLLTAWFGVYTDKFELIDELDIALRPESEDDFFSVSAKALEINKINLVEHFKVAETKSTAGKKLYDFLNKHSKQGAEKLVPVGQNVTFDISKVNDKLMNKKTWDVFVNYRPLNAGSILMFLQVVGMIPTNVEAGLSSIIKYLGLEFEGNAHEAKADAVASIKAIEKMVELVRSK